MSDWDYIESGFNSANETINFGTRLIGGLDNLYETSTLAIVKSNEDNDTCGPPEINGLIQNGSIYFAINRSMRIFNDLLCTDVAFNITCSIEIDTFCVSSDSKYLLLCLQNGFIRCFNSETKTIVYTKSINRSEDEDLSKPFFIKSFFDGQCNKPSFVLVLNNGKVIRIETDKQICENENSNSEMIEFVSSDIVDVNSTVKFACFKKPYLFLAAEEIYLFNSETQKMITDDNCGLKDIFFCNSRMILGLTEEGHLINICIKTLFIYKSATENLFQNILLIEDNSDLYILGTLKKNEVGEFYLQLLHYPNFEIIFSLKMSENIHLITLENVNDDIIYISKITRNSKVSELRFQAINETDPEIRLKRLLRRKKFEEAEQFAELFNLNFTIIQMAKVETIVDKNVCNKEDIDTVLDILGKLDLDDTNFQIKCCINLHTSCSNLEDVQRILEYGYSLRKHIYEEDILHNVISSVMHRFQTFSALAKCDGETNDVSEWCDFSDCNLINKLITSLEKNQIDKAIIIYNRLDIKTIEKISKRDIEKILDLLINLPTTCKFQFLYTFVPLTLFHHPSYVDSFIKWTFEEVFYYESKYPTDFPKNAIDFVNKMISLLKQNHLNIISFQHLNATDRNSKEKISSLLDILQRLEILKNNCAFFIPYQQFMQGTKTLIKTLLNPAMVKNIKSKFSLERFIHIFLLDNETELDEVYVNLIQELTVYSKVHWINVVDDILQLITSVDKKLEIILTLVKSADIPWCETTRKIASLVQQYNHPLVEEVLTEIKYESKCCVLKKESYNFKSCYINSLEYFKFVINRIIYCQESTMIEDIYKICTDVNEKHQANILLLNHFIQTSNFESFLNLFENNSEEDNIDCCKALLKIAAEVFKNKEYDSLRENFNEVLSCMVQKLQNAASRFKSTILEQKLNTFILSFQIKKEFDISFTPQDVEKSKEKVLDQILTQCMSLYAEEGIQVPSLIKKSKKIAWYLNIEMHILLSKLFNFIDDFKVILEIIEYLCESLCDLKIMCYVVSYILKNIGSPNLDFTIDDSTLSTSDNLSNFDINTSIKALKLANKIIIKLVVEFEGHNLQHWIELSNWISTTHFLIQDNETCFLNTTQEVAFCAPTNAVLNAIQDCFLFYATFMKNLNPLNVDDFVHLQDISKSDEKAVARKKQLLQSNLRFLYSEGHGLTSHLLIRTLKFSLMRKVNMDNDIYQYIDNILSQSTTQLLKSVLSMPYFDIDLIFGLIIPWNVKKSNTFLNDVVKTYKRDSVKLELIAKLWLKYLRYKEISEHRSLCIQIIQSCKWWTEIKNCQVPYNVFFRKSREVVLENLIEFNHMDIDLIQKYCVDFNLNTAEYYVLYLKNVLKSWKPNYVVSTSNSVKYLVMKTDEQQLFTKCNEVIQIIDNKDSVVKIIKEIWSSINFYHYEVFLCLFNIISTLKENIDNYPQVILLKFLRNYERINPPGITEVEEWYTLYPDSRCIDNLSNWRLPYTNTLTTNKVWNIIRTEINIKTYPKWFDAITYMKNLSKDDVCSFVIKDIASSGVFKSNKPDEWNLYPKHIDLLNKIDDCVQNINNLEKATSAIYFLANAIPGGADRVNAMKLCYKYALKYQVQNSKSQDVQTAFNKVEKKYFGDSTTHILYKYQLANKKYLDMVSRHVDELILELYMDDRIIKKANFVAYQCPDINKAIDELAILYNINIEEKRKSLLITWLSDDVNLDTSIFITPKINYENTNYDSSNSINLIRASYICSSGDIVYWQKWLLELGEVKSNETTNLKHKANALKCLCKISNPTIIYELTDILYNEFINYINKLILISNLESYGFYLSIESLDSNNKLDLLNHLAYHKSNQLAIRNMALLCMTYTINDYKYWLLIVNQMLKLTMFQELMECLAFLNKHFEGYINKKFIIDAWQSVINNLFNKIANCIESDVNNLWIQNFQLIQACPVLHYLDLNNVVKKCFELKKYNFAALLVQFLSDTEAKLVLEKLFALDYNVYEGIEELSQFGFWSITNTRHLLQEFEKNINYNSC